MNLLSDIINYVRRIIKAPSNSTITDSLIIDYINRFWIMDVDARIQLFDLKTKYQFQTIPGIDQYNMPLYNPQLEPGNQPIGQYPIYQGFMTPAFVNGIQVPLYTQRQSFFNLWPNYTQSSPNAAEGDGTTGPYNISLPFFPALPGHIDMTGIIASGFNNDPIFTNTLLVSSAAPYNGHSIIPSTSVYSAVYFTSTDATGNKVVVADSGQFLNTGTNSDLYGLLMAPGQAPFGDSPLTGGYSTTVNTVNYNTGVANVTFPTAIPAGNPINVQCYFYQQGLPRALLFYNNCLTIRPPCNISYLVEVEAYLTPSAFLNTGAAIPFAYMAEYIARGAARKMLSDTGDIEQFQFYEPLFREQEMLVWKRSQRQFTSNRTATIFSDLQSQAPGTNIGQGGV
jgi:hypothetical protein